MSKSRWVPALRSVCGVDAAEGDETYAPINTRASEAAAPPTPSSQDKASRRDTAMKTDYDRSLLLVYEAEDGFRGTHEQAHSPTFTFRLFSFSAFQSPMF